MSIAALWDDEIVRQSQPTGRDAARREKAFSTAPALAPLHLRRPPRREPPFDDEVGTLRLVGARDQALPFESLAEWAPSCEPNEFDRFASATQPLPPPAMFARRILIAVVEAFSGRRTVAQLGPYLTRAVFSGLHEDAVDPDKSARWRDGATVRSIHVCEPAAGVAEVAAVLRSGTRSRAAALRLEARNGRWQCVLLQIG